MLQLPLLEELEKKQSAPRVKKDNAAGTKK